MKLRNWMLAAAGVLSACVLPQKEDAKVAPLAAETLGLHGQAYAPFARGWWQVYQDPQLNALIEAALAHNPSLDEAMARARAAAGAAQQAGAGNRPALSFDASEVRQRFSENSYFPPPFGGGVYWLGQAGFNLGWTLDFWGRQAALIAQARSQQAAAELDRASAELALAGAIAQAYVDFARASALVALADQEVDERQAQLALTQQRVDAGLDGQLALKAIEALLPQAQAEREQLRGARTLAIHQLAALSGRGADAYPQMRSPQLQLDAALPLPSELPVDLLAHRPDVAAARLRVDAAQSGRDAAKAAFYPDFSLSAFVGVQSISLDTLLKSGSTVYGAGPAVHLPIFDAQRLRGAYRGATAELDAAVGAYNDTVLQAIRQAADQLSQVRSVARQIDDAQRSEAASASAYRLAQQRAKAGLSSRLAVLAAENQWLAARRTLVDLQCRQAVARVSLLLTLGGSFTPLSSSTAADSGASS